MFDNVVEQLLVTEWGKHLGFTLMFIMGLWVSVLCVDTLSQWHTDFVLTKKSATSTVAPLLVLDSIEQIPERHLFGKLGAAENYLPITSLQLRLVGVIKSEPEQLSKVIISESGQPGKVYQIGDTLPCGVSVASIADDGVVLANGDHLEKLPLRRSRLQFQGPPKSLLGDA